MGLSVFKIFEFLVACVFLDPFGFGVSTIKKNLTLHYQIKMFWKTLCVCVCVCVCMRACVRVCVRACVSVNMSLRQQKSYHFIFTFILSHNKSRWKIKTHTAFIWKQYTHKIILKTFLAFTLHAFVITDIIPHLSGLWVVFVQNKLSLIEVVVVSVMKYIPLLFRQENTSQSSINTDASEITLAELSKHSL